MEELMIEYNKIFLILNDVKNNTVDKKFKEKMEFQIKKLNHLLNEKNNENKNIHEENDEKIEEINNETNNIKYENYEEKLKEIFNNPNEESVKVWLKNFLSYAKENKLTEGETNIFIFKTFKKYDKEEKYINKLNIYINEIKGKTISQEQDYINTNIIKSNNDNMKKEFNNIVIDIGKNIINNEKEDYENNFRKYKDYIKKYNLDEQIMINYLKKYIKKMNEETKKENNFINVIEENKKTNDTEHPEKNETLKIINMKKSFNSKVKNKELAVIALANIGIGLINPLFGISLGIISYGLYKKGIKSALSLIESNGLKINEQDELIDSKGKKVDKEDIGTIKYNLIKSILLKTNNDNGLIDKKYKKASLFSKLINNKTFNNIKEEYNEIKNEYKPSQLVKDINSGMRKI